MRTSGRPRMVAVAVAVLLAGAVVAIMAVRPGGSSGVPKPLGEVLVDGAATAGLRSATEAARRAASSGAVVKSHGVPCVEALMASTGLPRLVYAGLGSLGGRAVAVIGVAPALAGEAATLVAVEVEGCKAVFVTGAS